MNDSEYDGQQEVGSRNQKLGHLDNDNQRSCGIQMTILNVRSKLRIQT